MVSLVRNRKMIVLFNILSLLLFFASGQAFAWTQSANFESGTVGQLAVGSSGFNAVTVGSGPSRVNYSNSQKNSGNQSASMAWVKGDEGFSGDTGEFAYSGSTEVWIRGYYYFPSGWSWANGSGDNTHAKTLRINETGQGFISFITRGAGPGQIMYSNEPAGGYEENLNAYMDIGRWQCLELYVKSGNPGIVRMWKDGVLIKQDTSHATGSSSAQALVMSQWNNGPTQNQTQYVDDFIVTSDTPSGRDSAGNPMIGPISGSTSTSPLSPPTRLVAIAK